MCNNFFMLVNGAPWRNFKQKEYGCNPWKSTALFPKAIYFMIYFINDIIHQKIYYCTSTNGIIYKTIYSHNMESDIFKSL